MQSTSIKYILSLCFITLWFLPAWSQDNASRLQQAEEAYTKGEYETSIQLYEQILASGQDAFELYYNLGNAYYKNNQVAPAILNYERAAKIKPSDADLQHNLRLAQALTVDKIESLTVPEFVTGFKSFVNYYTADSWGLLSITTFLLVLGSLLAFLFLNQRWIKQLALGAASVLLFLSILFFIFGWQQQRWLNSNKEAIIFKPSITVQSTPDQGGEELFVLHAGTKVRIMERFRDWVRIRISNGNMGWVPIEAAAEI